MRAAAPDTAFANLEPMSRRPTITEFRRDQPGGWNRSRDPSLEVPRFGAGPAAQEGQVRGSKPVAVGIVGPAPARTRLAEEACVGETLVAVDSPRPAG